MTLFRPLICVLILCASAVAAETFYSIPVGDLQTPADAKWPDGSGINALSWESPRIVMQGGAEAYLLNTRAAQDGEQPARIVVRAEADNPIAGQFYFPLHRFGLRRPIVADAPRPIAFTATAQATPTAKADFYLAKAAHYRDLQDEASPGAPWFRHVADAAAAQAPGQEQTPRRFNWRAQNQDPYDLFTGGRAISENLQLNRELQPRQQAGADVPVDSIAGITVAEMDFKALLGNSKPALDPLAAMIPQDQYAIFFPAPAAMFDVMDKVDQSILPVAGALMPGGEEAGIARRYERQLGLERTIVGRMLLQQSVKTIVVTGSDLSFPLGTDIALVFETDNPGTLAALLNTQIATAAAKLQARPEPLNIGTVSATAYRSPDRAISSHVAIFPKAVVVTNSPAQLRRLAELSSAQSFTASLEYQYFRSRYAINESESLLAVLPDAAIRKWCSARYRVADARRVEARAKLLEQIATSIDQQQPAVAVDPTYGSRDFMTPVSELDLTTVTASEADAYKRWRDNYQRNWRGAFDPIAIRLNVSGTQLAGDVMVMPLIASSDYREFIEVTRNAKLDPTSGDPHDTLLHFVMAIDRESAPMKQFAAMGDSMTGMKIDLLAWLGKSVSIYADDDPYWAELLSAESQNDFMTRNVSRLPLAIRADSSSPLKLAAFLAAVRGKIEQSAPGLTVWQNLEHAGKPYVKVSSGQLSPDGDLSVYYAAFPDSLTITLSEPLIKRALERTGKPAAAPANPWLGDNLALKVDSEAANLLRTAQGDAGAQIERASWQNIPILNEWKRLFPKEDPVAFHERAWGVRLVCPAGGQYVWDEKLQTMRSTAAGSPEAPIEIPRTQLVMNQFSAASFGLTFENGGVRARMSLDSDPTKARKPAAPTASPAKP